MILKIVVAVIAIVMTFILLRKKINIGIIMLINSLFIAIGTRMPFNNTFNTLIKGSISEKTLSIIFILILIMVIENIMRTTGMITQMVDNLKELLGSNRIAAMVLPTVLGLLPSPGGARFSCPMVEQVLKNNAKGEEKAFINYWYRHVWMDGFILYPGIILASELLNVPVIKFFSYLFVFMILHALIGFIMVGKKVEKEKIKPAKQKKEALKAFMEGIAPIVLIIGLYIILLQFSERYALHIAALITIIALFLYKRYNIEKVFNTIKKAFNLKYVIIIIGVMVFKEFLIGSGLMNKLMQIVDYYNIPVEILFVVLPFIGGFSSGITVSFVSLTFPILIPLGLGDNIWYALTAFVCGFAGVMITPLHLCAIISADYFKVKVNSILSRVALAELFICIAAVLEMIIVKVLG